MYNSYSALNLFGRYALYDDSSGDSVFCAQNRRQLENF